MDEFIAIANDFVPPAFNSGNFPLSLTPPPLSCPSSGTFDLLLTLPHYYGSAVNVTVTSNPPGLASVVGSPIPSVYWDTSLAPAARKKEQTIRVACSSSQDLTSVSLAMTDDSDSFHYSLDDDSRGFTISQTLPVPVLRLNFSSPLLLPFNGAQLTTVAPAPLASPVVVFDGYSSFLDLNTAADTGVQPQAALGFRNIPDYLQSPDLTGQLQPGWSADGWYQATSLAHPATLFSCGENAASEALTAWTGTTRTGPAIRSIVVAMSVGGSACAAHSTLPSALFPARSPHTHFLLSFVCLPLISFFLFSGTIILCSATVFPSTSFSATRSTTIGTAIRLSRVCQIFNPSSANGQTTPLAHLDEKQTAAF